jgi:hypothetical protein
MRSLRAVVFAAIFVFGIVPNASAGVREGDRSGFYPERIVRVVKQFLRTFGITNNADQVIGPRP